MRCVGWDMVVPKAGTVECSFDGIQAEPGGTCLVTCDKYYVTETDTVRCIDGTGWVPTRSPECTPDGSLTVIIVPAVVGSIVALLLLTFIFVRTSNRCQRSTRAHDEDDVEKGVGGRRRKGQNYMMKTSKRPGGDQPQRKRKTKKSKRKTKEKTNSPSGKIKKRRKTLTHKWRKVSFRQKFTTRLRNGKDGTRALMRRGIKNVKSPWRQRGPRRVVGSASGVGNPSMCVQAHHSSGHHSAEVCVSSCCSTSSSWPCPDELQDVGCQETTYENKILPPPSFQEVHSLPPLRPPVPNVISRKASFKTNAKIIKNIGAEVVEKKKKTKSVSSGYSSDERRKKKRISNSEEKRRRRKKKESEMKRRKKNKEKEVENPSPFNNYPVCASDRQYQDFEHDYRKNGHVFDGGEYHPQYQHHVKSYPVKPVRKKEDKKSSDDEQNHENTKPPISTGGVKYYAIKPDRDEIKKIKKDRKKSKSKSDRSKSKDSRRKAKRDKSRYSPRKTKHRGREEHRRTEEDKKVTKHSSTSKHRSKKRDRERSRRHSRSDED